MDLVTTRFMTKFSISMSLEIFGHQLSLTIVDNQNFLVTNFWSPHMTIKFFNMTENIGSSPKIFSCLINNDHWSKDWQKNLLMPKNFNCQLGWPKTFSHQIGQLENFGHWLWWPKVGDQIFQVMPKKILVEIFEPSNGPRFNLHHPEIEIF